MNTKTLKLWLSVFSIIGVLWGVVFAFSVSGPAAL
jgi:hypothetical protein